MKRVRNWFIGFVVVLGIIAAIYIYISVRGGFAGIYAIIEGSETDYITGRTTLGSRVHTIFIRNTHDTGFCTASKELYDLAERYRQRELYALITYRTINESDLPSTGCDPGNNDFDYVLITGLGLTEKGYLQNLQYEKELGIPHEEIFDAGIHINVS